MTFAIFYKTLIILIAVLLENGFSYGEHILFLQTSASYSHRAPQWPLVRALVKAGHSVTYMSPFSGGSEMSDPKVNDILLSDTNEFMSWVLSNFDIYHRIYGIAPPPIVAYDAVNYGTCMKSLQSKEFQQWLNETTAVDLIFTDVGTECGYGLARKFKSKFAIFSTLPPGTRFTEGYGISPESNVYPEWGYELKPPLTFFNRAINSIIPLVMRASTLLWYNFMYPAIFKEHLGLSSDQFPNAYEMEANTSLIFLNGDYLEDFPRSLTPFVVKIPAMHIHNVENVSLSQEMEEFINAKDCLGKECDGTVYISFGTVCNAPSLPEYFRQYFFKSIESFPQYKFIWRWKGERPKSFPNNLLLVDWVHQQKLLSHPKTKLFITQSGRPSTQEALYFGVPTISFPILADQDFNADRMETLGISISLDIATITQEKLMDAISKTLTTEYAGKAKRMAKLAKDVHVDPVEKALWWTEFVLRHSQEEINLLKPHSQGQYWFQRREWDTWIFILICLNLIFCCQFYCAKFLISKLKSRFSNKKSKVD